MREHTKENVKKYGEIFTPPALVKQMLDTLSLDNSKTTVLDPCCGSGNILVEALQRKLDAGHNPIEALSTIFGVEIQERLVVECRKRLLYKALTKSQFTIIGDLKEVLLPILEKNIVCGNFLKGEFDGNGNWRKKKS